jgi:hypothetical protein
MYPALVCELAQNSLRTQGAILECGKDGHFCLRIEKSPTKLKVAEVCRYKEIVMFCSLQYDFQESGTPDPCVSLPQPFGAFAYPGNMVIASYLTEQKIDIGVLLKYLQAAACKELEDQNARCKNVEEQPAIADKNSKIKNAVTLQKNKTTKAKKQNKEEEKKMQLEQVQLEQVQLEQVQPEQVQPEQVQPEQSEDADTEDVDSEYVDSEDVDSEDADTADVDSEDVDSEHEEDTDINEAIASNIMQDDENMTILEGIV